MADESEPVRVARRAADDAPTIVLPVIGARAGARRSVTPDWDDSDDDWDDEEPDAPLPAAVVPPPPPGSATGGISVSTTSPASHDAFRPPADDADTVVIKRGDIAAALAAMGVTTPIAPALATPTWHPVAAPAGQEAADARPAPDDPSAESADPAETDRPLTAMERLIARSPEAPDGNASGSADTSPTRPVWLVPVVLVAVLALVVTLGVVWWNGRAATPTQSASTSRSAATAALTESGLVGAAEAALGVPVGWSIDATDSPAPATPSPLCLTQVAGMPNPVVSYQRKLTGAPATMLHRADAYASVADATAVAATRLTQLGRCATVPAYLSSGAVISGLGDQAVAVTAVIQDTTPIQHTILLVRTGTVIDVIDVWQPTTAVPVDKVLATAAAVVGKQCQAAGGACVSAPTVAGAPPPSGGLAGWLTVSDLPRITPGFGRWTASEPSTTIRIISSQCENLSFATVPGPTQRRQRTFLLTEDAVPKGFGLDELLLDFDTPEAATTFAKTVTDNIDTCTSRVPTAKLGAGAPFSGTGTGGEPISGYWRTISQPTSAATTATFRVGVAVVGKRVVYLLLTPSGPYDLSDEAWTAVGLRAAQRATQQA